MVNNTNSPRGGYNNSSSHSSVVAVGSSYDGNTTVVEQPNSPPQTPPRPPPRKNSANNNSDSNDSIIEKNQQQQPMTTMRNQSDDCDDQTTIITKTTTKRTKSSNRGVHWGSIMSDFVANNAANNNNNSRLTPIETEQTTRSTIVPLDPVSSSHRHRRKSAMKQKIQDSDSDSDSGNDESEDENEGDDGDGVVESLTTSTTSISTLRNKSALTTIVSTHNVTHIGSSTGGSSSSNQSSPSLLSATGGAFLPTGVLPPIVEEYLMSNPIPSPPKTVSHLNIDDDNDDDGKMKNVRPNRRKAPPRSRSASTNSIISSPSTPTKSPTTHHQDSSPVHHSNFVLDQSPTRDRDHKDNNHTVNSATRLRSCSAKMPTTTTAMTNSHFTSPLSPSTAKTVEQDDQHGGGSRSGSLNTTAMVTTNNNSGDESSTTANNTTTTATTGNGEQSNQTNNPSDIQLTLPIVNRARSRSGFRLNSSNSPLHYSLFADSTKTPSSASSTDESQQQTPLWSGMTATPSEEDLERQRIELSQERRQFEMMKNQFLEFMRSERIAIAEERQSLFLLRKQLEEQLKKRETATNNNNNNNNNRVVSPRTGMHDHARTDSDIGTSSALTSRTDSIVDDIDYLLNQDNSYDEAVERLNKRKSAAIDIKEYQDVLREDETTSKKRASVSSKVQIAREVSLLIGDRSKWSSESAEASAFRNDMSIVHRENRQTRMSLAATEAVLPPLYLSNDPAIAQYDKKKDILCKIFIPEANVTKTIVCKADTTADKLLETLVTKMSTDGLMSLVLEEHLFRASGFGSDYIYGDTPIIQFEHVWNCLKSENRVTLTVDNWETLWNELDLQDIAAKSIDYKFDQVIKANSHTAIQPDQIISWKVSEPFRFKIMNLKHIEYDIVTCELYVWAQLLMGNLPLSPERFSQVIDPKSFRFGQYINFTDVLVSELPREASLHIVCYVRPKSTSSMVTSVGPKDVAYASINIPVYNHNGELKSGRAKYRMWPGIKKYLYTENTNKDKSINTPKIKIEFDTRDKTVVYCDDYKQVPPELSERWIKFEQKRMHLYPKLSHNALLEEFQRIINTDPLYQLNDEEKYRLWSVRSAHILTSDPRVLSKFLQSVPWSHPQAIAITDQLLDKWEKMKPVDAIGLLNYNFPSGRVRRYAVKILSELSDNELKSLLLQLVQTLKFELYHDSALARFLIERSLKSTHLIGHVLFWHMKSEMHDPSISERYGLILEEYLLNCGSHRRELLKQNGIVEQLFNIAMLIKETNKADQVSVLRQELAKMTIPPKFKLPLSTRVDLSGILIDKCKVMNSKKLPLWLVFENADRTGSPVYVIFKAGDDLRQDLLTLQLLNNMDALWKQNDLNLRLNPYGCVCLGDMIGMIEVVLNSDTIANITHERGGATAAFSVDPLTVWLRKNCRTEAEFEACVRNFVRSCAGYCVATYVLGIGDRHNDNIMLSRKGDLFHIDFGHFLGNFKSFKGIYKRETTPFVFTPMYAHVMGGTDGESYKQFVKMGCDAFLVLRKNGHMLMNLFLLMLSSGIPELTSIQDIAWLRKVLKLHVSEEEAIRHFEKQIKKSLKNTRARINDAVHIYAKK